MLTCRWVCLCHEEKLLACIRPWWNLDRRTVVTALTHMILTRHIGAILANRVHWILYMIFCLNCVLPAWCCCVHVSYITDGNSWCVKEDAVTQSVTEHMIVNLLKYWLLHPQKWVGGRSLLVCHPATDTTFMRPDIQLNIGGKVWAIARRTFNGKSNNKLFDFIVCLWPYLLTPLRDASAVPLPHGCRTRCFACFALARRKSAMVVSDLKPTSVVPDRLLVA